MVGFYGISTVVGYLIPNPLYTYCDGKFTKIPKWDSTFRMREDGADWHLIPCRISPRSEFFLEHIGTGILCGGLIYGQTDRRWQGVSKFHTTHTPTKATSSSSPRTMEDMDL